MIINGTSVRAFGYLALSCFQAKYPNPNRNSFWQVAVSWEFFQILRALPLTEEQKSARSVYRLESAENGIRKGEIGDSYQRGVL